MENKRRALGKGLEQLFGSENVDLDAFEQNIVDTASNNDEIKQIKLSEIRSNPYQPRTYFNEEALSEKDLEIVKKDLEKQLASFGLKIEF